MHPEARRSFGRRIRPLLAGVALCALSACATTSPRSAFPSPAATVRVLGVENFYADIATQIGGGRIQVNAILSDPSVDPHVYETNVDDARLVANADIVIKNSVGYDAFIDKLLAASPRSQRIVVDVGQLTGHKEGDNPHLWYDTFNTMPALVSALTEALAQKDPSGQDYYTAQGQTFLNSLQPIQGLIQTLQRKYAGVSVLATEPLWNYQATAAGLNMLDPDGPFQKATEEGNDPPALAVVKFRDQLTTGTARMLIFNNQAVTPISQQMQTLARQNNVSVVGMSETEPPNTSYQQWMTSQLQAVLQALGG
jgi:zinc/manganese transport system substrate-binding protein